MMKNKLLHGGTRDRETRLDKNKRFYFLSLAALAALSAYPLANGARMAWLSAAYGALEPWQYTKYIVPYAAICVALLVFAALRPAFQKMKRLAFPVGIGLAYGVFFPVERYFETMQVIVTEMVPVDPATLAPVPNAPTPALNPPTPDPDALFSGSDSLAPGFAPLQPGNGPLIPDSASPITPGFESPVTTIDSWQAALCMVSPDVQAQPVSYVVQDIYYYVIEGSAYKAHYYLISFILITMACGLVYGAAKMIRDGDLSQRKPILMRAVSTAALAALCLFANATAFFRQMDPIQTPLASFLTALFFVALGAAAGIYAGSYLLGKSRRAGIGIPVLLAFGATALMYAGEAAMMQGNLYRFGVGWFFTGLPGVALAPADILIMLLSGGLAWLALGAARKKPSCRPL